MLSFTTKEDRQNNGFCFIGASSVPAKGGLISSNVSLISSNTSLISTSNCNNIDSCSFYDGPTDSTVFAFGESYESCGVVADAGSESCGIVAYSYGGESAGSVASSVSSDSGFSGGCSYSLTC